MPEIALDIPLTCDTIPRLVNLLGPAKAKSLTLLCERLAAPEAMSLGLVDYISGTGQALTRANPGPTCRHHAHEQRVGQRGRYGAESRHLVHGTHA